MITEMERPMVPLATHVIEFARETYSDTLIKEMLPLWKDHYKEIALYKDIDLCIDVLVYENAEKRGMLRIFTARHEKKLVGYEVFFIHPHPHYATHLEAVQDSLFLDRQMRRGSIGYRFIKWVDDQLSATNASVIFRCVSNMNDYAPLLERLGYQKHDVVFSRKVQ